MLVFAYAYKHFPDICIVFFLNNGSDWVRLLTFCAEDRCKFYNLTCTMRWKVNVIEIFVSSPIFGGL